MGFTESKTCPEEQQERRQPPTKMILSGKLLAFSTQIKMAYCNQMKSQPLFVHLAKTQPKKKLMAQSELMSLPNTAKESTQNQQTKIEVCVLLSKLLMDGNGTIMEAELRQILTTLGEALTMHELDLIM